MEDRTADKQESPTEQAAIQSQEAEERERLLQHARRVVAEAPDIRAERVAAVKKALQNGTLNLDGADLAAKLIDQMVRDGELEA
jgi:flagellar biosynthesis anti-sigma factor FlgM